MENQSTYSSRAHACRDFRPENLGIFPKWTRHQQKQTCLVHSNYLINQITIKTPLVYTFPYRHRQKTVCKCDSRSTNLVHAPVHAPKKTLELFRAPIHAPVRAPKKHLKSTHQSTHQSAHQSTHQSVHQSTHLYRTPRSSLGVLSSTCSHQYIID